MFRSTGTDNTDVAPSPRGPSMVVVASVLAVGVAMFALGALLLTIVL